MDCDVDLGCDAVTDRAGKPIVNAPLVACRTLHCWCLTTDTGLNYGACCETCAQGTPCPKRDRKPLHVLPSNPDDSVDLSKYTNPPANIDIIRLALERADSEHCLELAKPELRMLEPVYRDEMGNVVTKDGAGAAISAKATQAPSQESAAAGKPFWDEQRLRREDTAGARAGARAGQRRRVAFMCPTCPLDQSIAYTTFQKWQQAHMGQLESRLPCKVLCPGCLKTRTVTKGPFLGQQCRTYNEWRTGHKTAHCRQVPIFRQRRLDAGNEDDVDGRVGDAAWDRVHHWFGKAQCAVFKKSGAIPVWQRPGDTIYLPAGYGHLVLSIGGDLFEIQGRQTPAPLVMSIPAWHNPQKVRLENLKSIHTVPFGEHSEAQLDATLWSSRAERAGAAGRILRQQGNPSDSEGEGEGECAESAEIAEYVLFPSTPTLVAIGARLGQGACRQVTKKLLQEIASAHDAAVWRAGDEKFRNSLDAPSRDTDTWMVAANDHIRQLRGDACDDDQRKFTKLFSFNMGDTLNKDAAISMFEGVSAKQAVEADLVALDVAQGASPGTHAGTSKKKRTQAAARQETVARAARLDALLMRTTLKHSHDQGVLNTLLLGSKLWLVWLPGVDGPKKACIRKGKKKKRARRDNYNVNCDSCEQLCTSGSFLVAADKEMCPKCFGELHKVKFRGYHNEPL